MFSDGNVMRRGAEAHSHQVDCADTRATVCLMWTGIKNFKKLYFFLFLFFLPFKHFSCNIETKLLKLIGSY